FAAALPVGSVTLTGRSLAFAGEAADIVSYEAAMRIARAPPPGYTVASLGIVPPLVQPFTWSVAREGGSLVLGGLVPSDAAREAVLKAAAAASDGGEVVDRTHVARGLDPALSFDRMAELSLDWIRRFDGGAVRLDGRVLSVEGRTGARDLVPGIERDIRRAPLFGAELGRVAISAVPPSPYWFGAKRAGGRLVLRGYLPAEADRAAILDIAGRRFPTEALVNNLHLADGAPAGIRHAAELGLLALSSLAEGETSLRDASLKLAGRALYPQYAARTREAVSGGVPAGWAAAVDIKVVPENPLDSTACADLLAEQVRREPVRFEPGSAELGPSARKALERLAGVIRRCGERRIRVTGRVETAGDIEPARELATRRAAAIVAALAPAEITAALEPAGIAARAGGRPPAEADAVAFEVLP
ncbi:MAG: hypothetical protein JWR08_774, partial [Enterovirga sp.]|nr:hypothetical protein [Enterovirga sp.]